MRVCDICLSPDPDMQMIVQARGGNTVVTNHGKVSYPVQRDLCDDCARLVLDGRWNQLIPLVKRDRVIREVPTE